MKVYLSLGSNLGDRLANLERALSLLGEGGCRVIKKSSIYETAPLYYLKQPAFFNMAAACETGLSPERLLSLLAGVEKSLKRRRLVKNGPRTIDIDILFYGGSVIALDGLQVPHPRLAQREFVLAPLAEIAPSLRHPVSGISAAKMLSGLKERGGARRLPSDYAGLEAWLKALPPPVAGVHYCLKPIKAVLSRLGSPQKNMGVIAHIAGSTGKSTSACMAAAALTSNGWRTGLYTSPHVACLRERIKIDGREISEKDLLACFLRVESVAAGELSFFELLTAAAFLYFSLKKTRFAVIEAGLGGRLDATNAADGAVAGITSVSLEHLALLGPRLGNVAGHKAGIIKKGAAAVIGAGVPPSAERIVRRRAEAVGARISRPGPLPVSAPAGMPDFQLLNAAFALRMAELAAKRAGLKLNPGRASRVLLRAVPPGRFQLFSLSGRRVIVDGAHNAEGVSALLKELKGRRPVCVAAFMNDKDAGGLALMLAEASSRLLLTRSLSYRSAPPAGIKKLLPLRIRRATLVIEKPVTALRRALKLAPKGGTVLVAGSLYLAGDILAGVRGRRAFHPREMLVK